MRPGELDAAVLPGVLNPIAVPAGLAEAAVLITNVANLVGVAGLLLASASLVVRYRRADPIEAAQIRWLALVGVLAAVAFVASITPVAGSPIPPSGSACRSSHACRSRSASPSRATGSTTSTG